MTLNTDKYREYVEKYKDKPPTILGIAEELLDEIDVLNARLNCLEESNSKRIIDLLYSMPWTLSMHGPAREVGSPFTIERWYDEDYETSEMASGVDLLEVLESAAKDNWKGAFSNG